MSGASRIEWTDRVWNPTVGCTRVSAGCEHCYAEVFAHRLGAMGRPEYHGLTSKHADGSVTWTGQPRMLSERIKDPLRWKKPQRVFVNSMSDLFHESVTDEFIESVFGLMAVAQQHTFQVLTKRPERILDWFNKRHGLESVAQAVAGAAENRTPRWVIWDARGQVKEKYYGELGAKASRSETFKLRQPWPGWPLPNVWLGVSVEDQAAADERIPLLLDTPAAVRFLSCEPLLGPLDLTTPWYRLSQGNIHWVIAGGESGPGGRWLVEPFRVEQDQAIDGQRTWWEPKPAAIDWVRSIRDQCQAADVPFFFKQWGGPTPKAGGRLLAGREWNEFPATDHGR